MYEIHFLKISSLHFLFVVFLWMPICQCCILMLGHFSASLRGRCCSEIFEAHRKKLAYLTNFSVTEFRDSTLPTWKPHHYTPYLSRFNTVAKDHETIFPNKYFNIILPFQYLYSKWTLICFVFHIQMISPHQISAQHNLKKTWEENLRFQVFMAVSLLIVAFWADTV